MSLTQAHLDAMGVSKESGESRDRGYVEYEGIQFKDVPNFYGTVGGRNGISEYYMYKDAPFDPDATLSVGNTLQGVDVFGMPTTRNIGFNVKFTF